MFLGVHDSLTSAADLHVQKKKGASPPWFWLLDVAGCGWSEIIPNLVQKTLPWGCQNQDCMNLHPLDGCRRFDGSILGWSDHVTSTVQRVVSGIKIHERCVSAWFHVEWFVTRKLSCLTTSSKGATIPSNTWPHGCLCAQQLEDCLALQVEEGLGIIRGLVGLPGNHCSQYITTGFPNCCNRFLLGFCLACYNR